MRCASDSTCVFSLTYVSVNKPGGKRILGIGTATLDIINLVDRFPREDEKIRALEQRRVRGGNAANTLVVLSQLGYGCGWSGVVADEPDSRHILADLERYGVDTTACVRHRGGRAPTSYVCLSRATGSRTIVHFRDLPEYTAEDFECIELGAWDWVHFEGRNVPETARMQARVKQRYPGLRSSLEVEKPRPDIQTLLSASEVLLFSRTYARACGHEDGARFLRAMRPNTGSATLFCAWGEGGAFAMDGQGRLYQTPAFPPSEVVDTLGAGDVFNAAVIDGMLQGRPTERVLEDACRLAGRKCGIQGLDGITDGHS